jgi:hypothetical protein
MSKFVTIGIKCRVEVCLDELEDASVIRDWCGSDEYDAVTDEQIIEYIRDTQDAEELISSYGCVGSDIVEVVVE